MARCVSKCLLAADAAPADVEAAVFVMSGPRSPAGWPQFEKVIVVLGRIINVVG